MNTTTLEPTPTAPETREQRADRIQVVLDNCHGTAEHHRLTMYRWLLATDGVEYLCTEAGTFWLLDLIGSHLATNKTVWVEDFQVWTLRLTSERPGFAAVVSAQDDQPGRLLATQWVEYTDFPLADGIKLYVVAGVDPNGQRGFFVMLPSEY